MKSNDKIKVFSISVLCAAILAGCGGGGDANFLGIPPGKPGDTGGSGGNGTGGTGDAGGNYPTVDKFLVDITDKGQQNSPIVASISNEGPIADVAKPVNAKDEIRFNQPGMVSEVCGWGDDCRDETAVQAVEDLRKRASDATDDSEKERLTAAADRIERQFPKDGHRVIRTINNQIITVKAFNTLDLGDYPSGDLGAIKIDKKRIKNAKGQKELVDYRGSIGRDFNGIWAFREIDKTEDGSQPEFATQNSFYRNPAVAGWSYQTFGYYLSTSSSPMWGYLRDQRVGYQSIGEVTDKLPTQQTFTYKGLSHAYYNDKQVTSHNEIVANFGNKSLSYKTTDAAVLHSIESGQHVIEERPDLNITGSAKWSDKNRFKGDVTTTSGLKGKIEGQFYGPNAEEVGGVYGLESDNVQYLGGFGAKR